MLVVLSEIDCLEVLKRKQVYPDEFYTSLEKFKNNAPHFKEATIIVIFAGNCRFNKHHTLELVKSLIKRASNPKDLGISHVYTISDMTIAGLRSYYKYEGNIDLVDIMHGWKSVKSDVNIWLKLRNEPKETKCYLSLRDQGIIDGVVAQFKSEHSDEDDYIPLIQIPNLKELLKTS